MFMALDENRPVSILSKLASIWRRIVVEGRPPLKKEPGKDICLPPIG